MGTAGYMAPEQAAGRVRDISAAADVWALGVILYELLTGQRPFKGPTDFDTLRKVITEEPVPPCQHRKQTPRDLEIICLTCLNKDPARRYASAEALANDLGRFRKGEPIAARPVGRLERAVKWTRRNPLVAGLLAAVTVSLLAGTTVATFFAIRANEKAAEAEKEKSRVEYALWISQASRAWQQNREPVSSVAISSDGRRIVSSSRGCIKVWDAGTAKELFTVKGDWFFGISRDGRRIVSGEADNTVKVWDAATGQEPRTLQGHTDKVYSVAISGDGRRIISGSGDRTVRVWDAATGLQLLKLKGHSGVVCSVAISSDGRRIVWASPDGTVRVWDEATGLQLGMFKVNKYYYPRVAISSDGRRIVSSDAARIKVWDAATGQVKTTLEVEGHTVLDVAISGDGRWIVSGAQDRHRQPENQHTAKPGVVKVWDAATGQEHLTINALNPSRSGYSGDTCVAISSDGRWIVSAGPGGIRLWDAATGEK
jgi:WD40 repeat protein